MGLLDLILPGHHEEREEKEEKIVVLGTPELLEPTSVPKELVRYLWGILEKDLPLSFLEKDDLRLIQLEVEMIAGILTLMVPEVPHPRIEKLLRSVLKTWIDEENMKLYGYVRAKRALLGMERRLTYPSLQAGR